MGLMDFYIAELAATLMSTDSQEEVSREVLESASVCLNSESGVGGFSLSAYSPFKILTSTGKAQSLPDSLPSAQHTFISIGNWMLKYQCGIKANSPDELVPIIGQQSLPPDCQHLLASSAPIHQERMCCIILFDSTRHYTSDDLSLLNSLTILYAAALKRIDTYEELINTRLEAQAANQKRHELLSNLSHEVRTPMNGILGMLELAIQHEKNMSQLENLYLARDSAEAMLNLLNNLFNFAEIEVGKLSLKKSRFSLRALIETIISSARTRAEGKGLELTCRFGKSVPNWIISDPERLRQVLLNLIGNAVKFTETGTVSLTIENSSPTPKQHDQDVTLIFIIQDTGIGISQERLTTIFSSPGLVEKSIARSYGGIGLGLVTSKQIIEMMGGDITVDTIIGAGSTFSFSIKVELAPLVEQTSQPIHPASTSAAKTLNRKIFDFNAAIKNFHHNIPELQKAAGEFIENTPDVFKRLHQLIVTAQFNPAEALAGNLNKTAAQLGFLKLAGEAFRLKMALRSADNTKINLLLKKIPIEFNLLKQYILEFQWDNIHGRYDNENSDCGR